MSWTDPNESVFESGDVLSEANLLASILDNLTHLGRGARVSHSIDQVISNSTETALLFDSETYDPDGFHSVVSNTSRLTVPASAAGRYLIGGYVVWESSPIAWNMNIRLNGTTMICTTYGTGEVRENINTPYDLAVGDYVEMTVFQGSGGPRTVDGAIPPTFWIQGVGGT